MHISDAVASLNYDRYQGFISNESGEAVAAVSADKHTSDTTFKVTSLVFDGPAYRGFSACTFTVPQYEYAQKHVRILSGLYGILKPWDLIQEYRLEVFSLFSFLFFPLPPPCFLFTFLVFLSFFSFSFLLSLLPFCFYTHTPSLPLLLSSTVTCFHSSHFIIILSHDAMCSDT
jgi:Peroxide stress protein YaaA